MLLLEANQRGKEFADALKRAVVSASSFSKPSEVVESLWPELFEDVSEEVTDEDLLGGDPVVYTFKDRVDPGETEQILRDIFEAERVQGQLAVKVRIPVDDDEGWE